MIIALAILIGIIVGAVLLGDDKLATNFFNKNSPPSFAHPFGTDWMGRDMLARTLKDLH